jgi:hypothetical protein
MNSFHKAGRELIEAALKRWSATFGVIVESSSKRQSRAIRGRLALARRLLKAMAPVRQEVLTRPEIRLCFLFLSVSGCIMETLNCPERQNQC